MSTTAFVIFKVEGDQAHVDARVRDLLRQWESEHFYVMGKEKTLLLACHAEVSLESLEAQFSAALAGRSATIHQIVHQEAPIPYAPNRKGEEK
jgi:hypothetical protein